jgi:tetratricopeptide (TPR) repeat protein
MVKHGPVKAALIIWPLTLLLIFLVWYGLSPLIVNWTNVQQLQNSNQPEPNAAEAMLLRSLTWPVPVMTNAYRLSANAYVKQADSDKAIERLQTAVTRNPHDYFAHLALADVYDRLGQPALAVYHYDQIPFYTNTLPEHNHWYERVIWNKLSLAEEKWQHNQPEQALFLLEELLELHPQNLSATALSVQIYADIDDPIALQDARSRLAQYRLNHWQDSRLLERDRQWLAEMLPQAVWEPERAHQIASFLIWYTPDADWVVNPVTEMATSQPDDLDWQLLLGELYQRRQETNQAITHYQALLLSNPQSANVPFQLGLTYLQAANAAVAEAERVAYQEQAAFYLQQYQEQVGEDWWGVAAGQVASGWQTDQPVAVDLLRVAGLTLAEAVAQLAGTTPTAVTTSPPIFLPISAQPSTAGWAQWGNTARAHNGLFWGGVDERPPLAKPVLRLQAEFEPQGDQRYVFGYRYEAADLMLPPTPYYALVFLYKTEGAESPRAQVRNWDGTGLDGQTLRLPHTRGLWRQAVWLFPGPGNFEPQPDFAAAFRLPQAGILYVANVYLIPVQISESIMLDETGVYALWP